MARKGKRLNPNAEYYLYLPSTGSMYIPPSKEEVYAFVAVYNKNGEPKERPIYWGRSFREVKEWGEWYMSACRQANGDDIIAGKLGLSEFPPGTFSKFSWSMVAVVPTAGKEIPDEVIAARDAGKTTTAFTD